MNPWSFPTPPTPTPFSSNMSTANQQPTSTNTFPPPIVPERLRVIPHLPVFLITRHTDTPPSPTQEPTLTSRHPRKWRFKLQMSLTFRCHMSLPKVQSLSKWRSKQPRPIPIIPVTPNYELMKTPMTPWTEDRPPSYHLQPYTPPRPDVSRMCDKANASSSMLSTASTASPTSPTPTLKRSKMRIQNMTTTTMTTSPGPITTEPPPKARSRICHRGKIAGTTQGVDGW
jgi:hypothetical protein